MVPQYDRRELLRLGGTACALGVAGCLSGSTGDGGVAGGQWPMAGHDLRNTGSTDAAGPTSDVEQRWESEVGTKRGLVVADGGAFVAGRENAHRVALDDGSTEWSADLPATNSAAPAVVDGQLYVGTEAGVRAFDTEDGEELWDTETDNPVHGSLTVAEGTVLAGIWDGTLLALNADDGSERWRTQSDDNTWTDPVVVDGTTYFNHRSVRARAVDLESGERQWSERTAPSTRRPIATDDELYFVDDRVGAVDPETGETLWETDSYGAHAWMNPAWDGETVYVGLRDCRVIAIDAEADATLDWEFDLGIDDERDIGHAVTVADETAYVTAVEGGDGHVHALDCDTGDEQWHETIGSTPNCEPVIAGGSLYVADVNHVYRFDEA
ncbi:outer membrane protein assembly factor BamB family protein [Halopiger goleimassiliensis]|uniref:outer membrane protein assembly factor BamB family protein n=1 Tax=Halopiger goleimassiliensis TaxID=1293048 RepID=UPI000677AD5C|nr:PQQ-binding-like beta-propeller repeat protein [Halopiger goleimassiliensis]